jgi:hypothetical protein
MAIYFETLWFLLLPSPTLKNVNAELISNDDTKAEGYALGSTLTIKTDTTRNLEGFSACSETWK